MSDMQWLMLNYTLPKEPSRVRVSVWRKLKKHGSVSIGQSMWILPASEEHLGVFNEISNEITQNNGSAYVLNANFITEISMDDIVNVFNKARDDEYQEFIDKCYDFFHEIEKETGRENFSYVELEENEDEYNKLEEWLKKIFIRDFFGSPLKKQAEQKLVECRNMLEDFSNTIYKSNDN